MLDLGTSFVASVARDPDALAIVGADTRLTYAEWFTKISAVVAGLDDLGLRPGDHLLTLLQNRWEAATLHWACQLAGIIITPLNWRAKPEDIEYCLTDADVVALAYEDASSEAVAQSRIAASVRRIRIDNPAPGETQSPTC